MEAVIKDKKLVITLDIEEHTSASGKSLVIASTHGNLTTSLMHNKKPVVIGVNAYVKK